MSTLAYKLVLEGLKEMTQRWNNTSEVTPSLLVPDGQNTAPAADQAAQRLYRDFNTPLR